MAERRRQQTVERKTTTFNVQVASVMAIDRLVARGVVASRSDAADRALLMFLNYHGEQPVDDRQEVAA